MFPFLRRNTAAEGTGGELVEVENDWVDPAVRAVREVGLDGESEGEERSDEDVDVS
jgi:hypothetical protein